MAANSKKDEILALASEVLAIEARAVDSLRARLDQAFLDACQMCLETPGRIVVAGMGKSGHISSKIAATLASTGTPSLNVTPLTCSLSAIRCASHRSRGHQRLLN